MLIDVADRIAADTGLDLVQQRTVINRLLNNAAKEMYDRLECNKIYWEVTLAVPNNKIITLPSYIGELRGIRRSTSQTIVSNFGMSDPRYSRQDWEYRWNNWRDLGESPVMINPSLVGKLVISSSTVEDTNAVVTISAQTNNALRIEEKVTMDEQSKQTTALFGPQIYSISCNSSERTSDITISDYNGVVLAVLYNVDRQSKYKMYDISEAPFLQDSGENCLVDILYKVRLRTLSKDSDQFPAWSDYDTAWYWMAMYLYYTPLENKPSDYASFFGNALMAMKVSKGNTEGNLDKRFTFGPNKYYDNIERVAGQPYVETRPIQ